MRLRVLIAAVAVLTAASGVSAQTLLQHFPQATIDKIAVRFSKTLHDGGITGVVADIKDCYGATSFKKTRANGEAIAACMLYDYSAMQLDKGMRTNFVAEGQNDPGSVSSYLSETALNARFQIYASVPFGDDPAAVGSYFADAPKRVLDKLKF
jgi:hypothetical protein